MERFRGFLRDHRAILILMGLLWLERLAALLALGPEYSLYSDDAAYVLSGITFARTGAITMHGVVSAQIMPGMPALIGLFALVFGEGTGLWLALKLLWITMGTLTAWYLYGSVRLFAPRRCGVAAALPLFAPNYVWMDNLILTETPFILFSIAMICYTLRMGKTGEKKWFPRFAASFLLALLMRGNMIHYPLLAFLYLLVTGYDKKRLGKQVLALVCALLCFTVPWSVRNYLRFDAFIPLAYGSGNPMLLGTYQGSGWPEDGTLDYAANVDAPFLEKYGDYYDEDGNLKNPEYERYLSLRRDELTAKYRMREWFRRDPVSFLRAYLISKPHIMLRDIFYWKEIMGVPWSVLNVGRKLTLGLAGLSFVLAFVLRRRRALALFLAALYGSNVCIYAVGFAFDRYAQSLVPILYSLIGAGLGLAAEAAARRRRGGAANGEE